MIVLGRGEGICWWGRLGSTYDIDTTISRNSDDGVQCTEIDSYDRRQQTRSVIHIPKYPSKTLASIVKPESGGSLFGILPTTLMAAV